jgi:hypothetical protein
MWALLAAIALILTGGAAQAQSANQNEPGLESCFRAAHAAIAVCSEQSDNPEQRVDCLAKARADQLECINRALSAAGNKPPENSKTARSASAAGGAATKAPDALKAPAPADSVGGVPVNDATATEQPDRTPGSIREPTEANKAPSMAPEPSGARTPEPRLEPMQANKPPSTAPEPSGAMRPDRTPEPTSEPTQANKLPSMAPEPSAMRPETSGKKDDAHTPQRDWVVSETTSPVDYSSLVSAVIRSTSSEKDGRIVLQFAAVPNAPKFRWERTERGACLAETSFRSTIKSRTGRAFGNNGYWRRTARLRPTRTMPWSSCGQYPTARH